MTSSLINSSLAQCLRLKTYFKDNITNCELQLKRAKKDYQNYKEGTFDFSSLEEVVPRMGESQAYKIRKKSTGY